MAFKITCTIFVVVYVSIAQAHKSDGSSRLGDVDDLLEQLSKASNKSLNEASKRFERAEKRLVDWSEEKLKYVETRMEVTAKQWNSSLTLIEERAKTAKVDIEDCVGNKETVLSNLTKSFKKDVESHINKTLDEAAEIAKNSTAQLNKTVDDTVAEYKKEIAACKSGSSSEKCLEGVAARIIPQIVVLPLSIEHQGIIQSSQITKLHLEAQEYSTEEFLKTKTQGNAIVEEIEKCVEKKIHK